MTGGIFLLGDDDALKELSLTPYESEALLQELIARYPNLLVGEQIDSEAPRRWLLVTREVAIPGEANGVNRWSLDHLFLDQDGIPTLVEVKRSTDTRIRREVVGQMLDYAANGVAYWPVETIRAVFESRQQEMGQDPAIVLSEFLRADAEPDAFWQRVKTNLQAGRIRLVFIADDIPPELRRVIEFLNTQMDPAEVLGIEVKQYTGAGLKGLVPRLLGQTEQSKQRKATARPTRQWDEASFFEELLRRRGTAEAEVARRLFDWARTHATRITFGSGTQEGSFYVVFERDGVAYYPLAVWTYGRVEVEFQYLLQKAPFDSEQLRRELLARLNDIPGVSFTDQVITKRPAIPLDRLRSEEAMNRLFAVLEWIGSTLR